MPVRLGALLNCRARLLPDSATARVGPCGDRLRIVGLGITRLRPLWA